MLTIRFACHPVIVFDIAENGEVLNESIVMTQHVIPPETATFESLAAAKLSFEDFLKRADAEGTAAIVTITEMKKIGERKFFGFDDWAKWDHRIHYDTLKQADS
jgi:hypothetical protein